MLNFLGLPKILGGLLVLSLVTLGPALWITRSKLADARETIAALEDWRDNVVVSIRLASDNPDVTEANAAEQVQALGHVRVSLLAAVEDQNAAITALERETEAAREVAARAEKQRRAAVKRTEELRARLRDRAAAPAEDMEAAIRRNQDELFEAGI